MKIAYYTKDNKGNYFYTGTISITPEAVKDMFGFIMNFIEAHPDCLFKVYPYHF